MTSRTPLLDQLLAIRNLLALNDHELEQIVNLRQEQQEGASLSVPTTQDTLTPTLDADALYDSYTKDINATIRQYNDHYQLRKELQRSLFTSYNIDLSYRCQFKHRLTVHEALKEIADATNSQADRERYYLFTNDLYLWIWEITGLWHTPCGRCLLDAESSPSTPQEGGVWPSKESSEKNPTTSTVNSIPTGPAPDSEKDLWEILHSIFSDLSKKPESTDPVPTPSIQLEDLNPLYAQFLCMRFGICTNLQLSEILNDSNFNNQKLKYVEDKILRYLVKTRSPFCPNWLTPQSLETLTNHTYLNPEILYYKFVMAYHLYSNRFTTLNSFAYDLKSTEPGFKFTEDFRVEPLNNLFLLYTFKPMKDLSAIDIAIIAKKIDSNISSTHMEILKKRGSPSLTFSQAYPSNMKYKYVKNEYLKLFFSSHYQDLLFEGTSFPSQTFKSFRLPVDKYPSEAKELEILMYLSEPRKQTYAEWIKSWTPNEWSDKLLLKRSS